ncbi:MAG: DUF4234 domain-containing protein [Candidatus Dormibacteraeota bacterium]|nr:DUF4234 domain-containing protein [Candidatus Dormibacteraeota bacterium]MBV9525406.1 DUF4234 domain-containing protein [Candidatus Dormibacteraeota bacterium]
MPHATRTKEKPEPVADEAVRAEAKPEEVDSPGATPAAHGSGSAPTTEASPPVWTYSGPSAPAGRRPAAEAKPEEAAPRARPIVPPSDAERRRTAGDMSLGPVGKRRSPVAVAILSAVTLGVYALVWHRRVNTEMGDFDTRMHVRPGRSTLAVALPWVLGLIVSLAGAARIVFNVAHIALPFDPHITVFQAYFAAGSILVVPYLELALSLSAVAIVMTLERVRIVEDRAGLTTDVQIKPAADIWLLAVPVVGGLMMVQRAQRRLNAAWEAAMPSPLARISQY